MILYYTYIPLASKVMVHLIINSSFLILPTRLLVFAIANNVQFLARDATLL